MALNEERIKILQMVQEGKINAEEASLLLEALDESTADKQEQPRVGGNRVSGKPGKYFRVTVTDTDSGKTRVNVRIPLGLVRVAMKTGKNFAPEIEGVDMEDLMQYIESGETGNLVDVFDEDDGERVEVYIE